MTALELATQYKNPKTIYEQHCRDAARKMIRSGRGNWIYYTQYHSGATAWRNDNDELQLTTIIAPESIPGSVE